MERLNSMMHSQEHGSPKLTHRDKCVRYLGPEVLVRTNLARSSSSGNPPIIDEHDIVTLKVSILASDCLT
jgi:catalase (peroxidase I)